MPFARKMQYAVPLAFMLAVEAQSFASGTVCVVNLADEICHYDFLLATRDYVRGCYGHPPSVLRFNKAKGDELRMNREEIARKKRGVLNITRTRQITQNGF